MNTKFMGAVVAVAVVAGTASMALAYRGDYQAVGPNHTADREAQMTQAMTTQNYSLWKSLTSSQGRVARVVTEANFAKFAEAWRLGKAGNTEAADAIRSELGLREKNGTATGAGHGRGNGNGVHDGTGSRGGRVAQ